MYRFTKWGLLVVLGLLVAVAAYAAATEVIWDTTGTGDLGSYTLGGRAGDPDSPRLHAFSFTVPEDGDYVLEYVTVFLNVSAGAPARIEIVELNENPDLGQPVASFQIPGPSAGRIFLTSVRKPLLKAGKKYWIVGSCPVLNDSASWPAQTRDTADHAFKSGEGDWKLLHVMGDPPGPGDRPEIGAFQIHARPVVLTVEVDIKPGSDQNSVNLKSNGKIPVAILTTADFDASDVDARSVQIGGVDSVGSKLCDVDGDGDLDLLMHVKTQDLIGAGALTATTTSLTISGVTNAGTGFTGMDFVRIVLGSTKGRGRR